jgi:hypothetical protein
VADEVDPAELLLLDHGGDGIGVRAEPAAAGARAERP